MAPPRLAVLVAALALAPHPAPGDETRIAQSAPAYKKIGGVYKWVDENGKVHFTDRPPPGVEAQSVEIKQRATPAPSDSDSEDRAERRRRLTEAFEAERKEKAALRARAKAEARERKAKCASARDRLKFISESAGRLYEEGDDGTPTYVSEERQTEMKAKLDAYIAKNC